MVEEKEEDAESAEGGLKLGFNDEILLNVLIGGGLFIS